MSVDLTRLPAPAVVEPLSFETILVELLADYQARYPEGDALLVSDPAYKLAEVAAYREVLVRARVNDAGRAVLLAYATGADLDHLAALFGVTRSDSEQDPALKERVQLAPEAFSVAGPVGAYASFARSAAPADIKDVAVLNPVPGLVRVVVLATTEDGVAPPELLATVSGALSAEDVRPLSDTVEVVAAEVTTYQVTASLKMYKGPDPEVSRAQAAASVLAFVSEQYRLGRDIVVSALVARLYAPGVQRAQLSDPVVDIVCGSHQAARCTRVTVTLGGYDE